MCSRYGRRTILGAGAGGVGVLATGYYGWSQYERRTHLRLRPLEIRSDADESVTLEVTLTDETGHREETETVRLEPSEGDTETRLSGPWMKYAGEWRLEASTESESLELTAETITDRLDDAGWGVDCAHITIVLTVERTLESQIEQSDSC
ncbi:hypothetical protein [Natronorubrum daqingense]|uniref:Uncharacterized protein n=1 Tax=Natronorubrum daqingense TaxID=588898 RepID=A0A1N6YN10_9EURY|nr:hypothetical protein [Natronorubrum daqingense]APX95614.1 hypothetical protein BB347_02730 [Natronorubrum daqingense]SIR15946.1 hypothetical protein SAMN05421809_0500 [Natronorubrum daqingense]